MPEFLRFCLVGGVAFLIDAILLEGLVYAGIAASVARIISIAIALQASYLMHSAFTYRGHRGLTRTSWLAFLSSNLIGAGLNYGVFLLVLHAALGDCPENTRLIALLAGTLAALMFNYWANRRFAFRRQP